MRAGTPVGHDDRWSSKYLRQTVAERGGAVVHLTLEPGYSVWTMFAVLAAAIALAGAFYRRAFRRLPAGRWPACI